MMSYVHLHGPPNSENGNIPLATCQNVSNIKIFPMSDLNSENLKAWIVITDRILLSLE